MGRSKISFYLFPVLLSVFMITGCHKSVENNPIASKTFPNAGNYPLVTVPALQDSVPIPDTLNVRAYVVLKSICPPNSYCFVPDGIYISNIQKSDSTVYQPFMTVRNPDEFSKNILYLMSIKVVETNKVDSKTGRKLRSLTLIGYNSLK